MRLLTLALLVVVALHVPGCGGAVQGRPSVTPEVAAPPSPAAPGDVIGLQSRMDADMARLSAGPTLSCEEVCRLSARICEAAEKICEIARETPADTDLERRCQRARPQCDESRNRCRSCQAR
jgi:hypothetical protein